MLNAIYVGRGGGTRLISLGRRDGRVTNRKALLFAVDPASRFAAKVGKQRSGRSSPTRAKQFARFLLSAKVKTHPDGRA